MLAAGQIKADGAGLLDHGVIDGLRAVFGERTGMLLSRTRQMVVERMEQMGRTDPGAEAESLARLAHEVGGMAGQVGMAALSVEALALERLCRQGEPDAARRAMVALTQTAAASLAELPRD
jgi:HPt (histidine-containing phosphotransfer) domain-containing protein